MSDTHFHKINCQECGQCIRIRAEQFGQSLRCPHCKTRFQGPLPSLPVAKAVNRLQKAIVLPTTSSVQNRKTAKFTQPAEVVYDATLLAIRRASCEITSLDIANRHVKFTATVGGHLSDHEMFVFSDLLGGSELQLRNRSHGAIDCNLIYSKITDFVSVALNDYESSKCQYSETGILYIVRESALYGITQPINIYINGQYCASLGNEAETEVELKAGRYSIEARLSQSGLNNGMAIPATATVKIISGKTASYYVKCSLFQVILDRA